MVLEGKGRLSRRKDGKYFLYLPMSVVGDSAFPFHLESSSVPVRVVIDPKGRILILPLDKAQEQRRRRG
jgi:hypothetical protein